MPGTVCSYLRSSDPVNVKLMDNLKKRFVKSGGLWIALYVLIVIAGAGAYQFRTRQQWITVSLPDPPAPLAANTAPTVVTHTARRKSHANAPADVSGNLSLPTDASESK